ncbi:MAG: hypothetical protein ACO2ZM_07165, partial [Francisellaceae bacterium]
MSEHAKYVIGIDLGTTNSAITYKPLDSQDPIKLLEIPQFKAPGQTEHKSLMPSFLYIPAETEVLKEDICLPWQVDSTIIVGDYAKFKAQSTPNRIISSVKSWLCQPNVDKRKALLPKMAPEGLGASGLIIDFVYPYTKS